MSFWDLSDNSSAANTGQEYEVPGGNLDPIPAGSSVLAIIDEAKWDKKPNTGEEFISLRWSVVSPDEYKNRKIFHKCWVTDLDPQAKDEAKAIQKRDKARRMLAAIDANAGGKLTAQEGKPSDDSMALHLCNKPMIITLMEWSMRGNDGSDMSGNWVSAVAPKSKGIDVKAPSAKAKAPAMGNRPASNDLDDEIPFNCEWRI
jgi:hypothetical protein